LVGYRLIRNRPNRRALLRLDRIARKYRGIIFRFDIAFDFVGDNRDYIHSLLLRHIILRWRIKGKMFDFGSGSVRWCPNGRPRNLFLYDRGDRTRLELRFFRAGTVRRQGVRCVQDLMNINPQALFEKHLKWSDVTNIAERFIQKIMRNEVDRDRARYAGKEISISKDQYRASLHRRVRRLLLTLGYDRAQVIRDTVSHRVRKMEPPLNIPTQLTWRP
jgi:hypothetical protein